MRVVLVVTNRASWARSKSIAVNLLKSGYDLHVIAGSAFAASQSLNAALPPWRIHRADTLIEGRTLSTMAESTGLALLKLPSLLTRLNPEAVITIADRYETLATAVASSYMNIPLVHIQGGETTGSIDDRVRKAITQLADIHYTATSLAEYNVARSVGERKVIIRNVGCPSLDLIPKDLTERPSPPVFQQSGTGCLMGPNDPYFVVQYHPVTTEYGTDHADAEIDALIDFVDRHSSSVHRRAVWLWPNVDAGSDRVSKKLRQARDTRKAWGVRFFENFEPEMFYRILAHAEFIVGNSSVGIRECSYMGVPAINVGTRQIGREFGDNVLDVTHEELKTLTLSPPVLQPLKTSKRRYIYGKGFSGNLIAEHLKGDVAWLKQQRQQTR